MTGISSSPLIQKSSLRRNNDVFTSVICNPLQLLSRQHNLNHVMTSRLWYERQISSRGCLSFPPDTKAFLYYFTSQRRPRIAGELRLRVVPSDDPASFESGSDLLRFNGQIWSRSLYMLSKHDNSLYEKLKEERLVPHDLDGFLSTFPQMAPRCQPLYTLSDTFIIDFSKHSIAFTIITEQGVETLRFFKMFSHDCVSWGCTP